MQTFRRGAVAVTLRYPSAVRLLATASAGTFDDSGNFLNAEQNVEHITPMYVPFL